MYVCMDIDYLVYCLVRDCLDHSIASLVIYLFIYFWINRSVKRN